MRREIGFSDSEFLAGGNTACRLAGDLNSLKRTAITNHRSGFTYFSNDNKLKSGYVTNILFMEDAKKRGYTKFDLLAGHEYYKRLTTNSECSLYWCLGRRGLGALAYTNLVRSMKSTAKNSAQQSPSRSLCGK